MCFLSTTFPKAPAHSNKGFFSLFSTVQECRKLLSSVSGKKSAKVFTLIKIKVACIFLSCLFLNCF